LIVEDSLTYAVQLEAMVTQLGYFVCARTDNSSDAMRLIEQEKPHLILMDIDIQGAFSGLEIGQKIKHLNIPILYISSSGDAESYNIAQESNMIGFLVKPIKEISLRTSLDLALSKAHNISKDVQKRTTLKLNKEITTRDAFYFTKNETIYRVLAADIAYIRAANVYTETVTINNDRYLSRTSLAKMEEILPETTFKRIHRKHIVQVSKISKVTADFKTVFVGGEELQVSKNRRKELMQIMNVVK